MLSLRQSACKGLKNGVLRNSNVKPFVGMSLRYINTPTPIEAGSEPIKRANGGKPGSKFNNMPGSSNILSIVREIQKVSETEGTVKAMEVLEEGVDYIRKHQVSERIAEDLILYRFNLLGNDLIKFAANSGDSSAEGILQKLIDLRIANIGQFYNLMGEFTKQNNLNGALNIWVKYLEYTKANPLAAHSIGKRDNSRNIVALAYIVYLKKCLADKQKPNFDVALGLLSVKELPSPGEFSRVMNNFGISRDAEIYRLADATLLQSVDPNDTSLTDKAMNAAVLGNIRYVEDTISNIRSLSQTKEIALKEETLAKIMNIYTRSHRVEKSLEIFDQIVKSGVAPSLNTMHSLINAITNRNYLNMDEGAKMMSSIEETIVNSDLKPNAETYGLLLKGYSTFHKLDKCESIIETLKESTSIPVTNKIKDNYIIALSTNNKFNEARLKLKEFRADGDYIPGVETFNELLKGYIKLNELEKAESVLEQMEKNEVQLDVATYTIIIDMLFKSSRNRGAQPSIEDIRGILKQMQQSKINVNTVTMASILDGLLKDGANIEAARGVFDIMKRSKTAVPSRIAYTSMIDGEVRHGESDRAIVLFSDFIKAGFLPETSIFNALISGFLKRGESVRALEYYNALKKVKGDFRHNPNHYTYYFLLDSFTRNRDVNNIKYVLNEMANSNLQHFGKRIPLVIKRLSSEGVAIPEKVSETIAKAKLENGW